MLEKKRIQESLLKTFFDTSKQQTWSQLTINFAWREIISHDNFVSIYLNQKNQLQFNSFQSSLRNNSVSDMKCLLSRLSLTMNKSEDILWISILIRINILIARTRFKIVFFYRQNNAYQNNSQNRNDRSRIDITIKIKISKKKSNEKEYSKDKKRQENRSFENKRQRQHKAYDKNKKNQNKSYQNEKNKYREIEYRDEKLRSKAYFVDENQEKNNVESENDVDYHHFHDVAYFDSNYEFKKSNNSKLMILINATTINIICRRCIAVFFFNNQFHKHLKTSNCAKSVYSKIYFNVVFKDDITLIYFKIDSDMNIKTKYEFKNWQYVIAQINLNLTEKSDFACVNSKVEIFLIDENYIKKKIKNLIVKTIITSISMRKLKTIKHITNQYAVLLIYFSETNSSKQSVTTVIIRKVHLINDFKVNFLIDNDILDSEKIDIFNSTESANIASCNVTISIIIKTETQQFRLIHAVKTCLISAKSECLMTIHRLIFLSDRDFLFESVEANFIIYAHLMNENTFSILIQNEDNKRMKISRNFRLRTVTKLDYFNVYQVNFDDVINLILRRSKFEHKIFWFRKIIIAVAINDTSQAYCYNAIMNQSIEIVLSNEIILHNAFDKVVNTFTKLINEYSNL